MAEMSIRSMVTGFLDKIVDARFKRDTQGRLMFLPWGFGSGRLVPDAAVEARLRGACRQLMIVLFGVAIPVMSAFNGFYQLTGLAYLGFFAACTAIGFASQVYPAWLSRNLPRSDERISYPAAMMQSLDRFGRKFLIFGLVTSIMFVAVAAAMFAFPPEGAANQVAMIICVLVFAPLAVVYAVALKRRPSGEGSAA
jgi:hypothetical protein